MTLQELITDLKAAGANENTLRLAMNCYELGKREQCEANEVKAESIERARAVSQQLRKRNLWTWDELDREACFALDALVAFAEFLRARGKP